MMHTLIIFMGAGLGGVLRYAVSNAAYFLFGRAFPFGTLVVNATGSFLMGLLFVLIIERANTLSPTLRSFILIGLLGGYTTFASFSIETINLLENGDVHYAMIYILLSVFLCLALVWLGILAGRQL